MGDIRTKRIYEPYEETDGRRILVDRLWPRGVSKEAAKLTLWMKEIAPSPELRQWFCHVPERFDSFNQHYQAELDGGSAQPYVRQLLEWSEQGRVTLLYAAKDEQCNHAIVLKQYLERVQLSE
ncbi:DUF488 domain-containing protein [Cohnella lubricantis]|uniref:DUF488 domain-containing protein n=1 Tax=Cohnella lubricantis TaxID=2163172 RepID=A0A841TCC5_9BACL|nr:DUF488 domain-containing protein [Cohnella lubricantis]MBB6676890.1 DUF488 domain-containing protein [Cohnella lubricantis]MBP2118290.1 uncharacterized protein YeaO (DUF488 family) [Cohnella lubricantis]